MAKVKERESVFLEFDGLNCGDCASKIEERTQKIQGVEDVKLNFLTKKMDLNLKEDGDKSKIIDEISDLTHRLEPGIEVREIIDDKNLIDLSLEGLNCADCAQKILERVENLENVESVDYNFLMNRLKVETSSNKDLIKDDIVSIVGEIEPSVEVKDLEKRFEDSKPKIDKRDIFRLIISSALAITPSLIELPGIVEIGLYLTAYIMLGYETILAAVRNIGNKEIFDENFLMTVATLAAIGIGEYKEAIMVMFLNNIGEIIESIAVEDSRDSIKSLMEIRPDVANLLLDGKFVEVDAELVKVGDIIQIKPGERIPLDGNVVNGSANLDTSSITGESLPFNAKKGDYVYSGSVNLDGLIEVKVEKEFNESTVSKILELVEDTSANKAPTESFITRFSKFYTPLVVVLAIGMFIVSQIIGLTLKEGIYRASVFLVISCPCALVISVPLTYFGGLGRASREGVLVKGGNYLAELANLDILVFDKTGTITEGIFEVDEIYSYGMGQDELLEIAALAESHSNHPIGQSIVRKYGKPLDDSRIEDYTEIAGMGLRLKVDGIEVKVGNEKLMRESQIEINKIDSVATVIYIAQNNKHIGTIVVADKIKDNAKTSLERLKNIGIKDTVMLSGDNDSIVQEVASKLEIDRAVGNLLPQDKVRIFEEILSSEEGSTVGFVGDGINDAPALARADVGIAMGALGSDAAIEASDIVIMTDDLAKIPNGVSIAKNTRKIVIQNIVFILGIKIVALILGALGIATMWQAVFADVGVTIIAILNSLRALNSKEG